MTLMLSIHQPLIDCVIASLYTQPLCHARVAAISSSLSPCMQDPGQLGSLHARVSSLQEQVSGLLHHVETRESALEAAYEQIAIRDGRVRALEVQLRHAEEQRSDAASALAARSEELRRKERELTDKDAELSTLKASTSTRQTAQHAQQQPQSQQQHRLQRVGSVASTTHR